MASQGLHEVLEKESVRGHHILKTYWIPVIGETLTTETEDGNEHDEYSVAVINNSYIVGHMPCSISKLFCFF